MLVSEAGPIAWERMGEEERKCKRQVRVCLSLSAHSPKTRFSSRVGLSLSLSTQALAQSPNARPPTRHASKRRKLKLSAVSTLRIFTLAPLFIVTSHSTRERGNRVGIAWGSRVYDHIGAAADDDAQTKPPSPSLNACWAACSTTSRSHSPPTESLVMPPRTASMLWLSCWSCFSLGG